MSELVSYIERLSSGLSQELIGLGVSLAGALILYMFRLRPKLVFGRPHSSRHVLNIANKAENEPDNFLEVYNEQFFVFNEGRRSAKNVEIVLSNFPRNIAINPPCDWTFKTVENGHCQVVVPFIAPKELITVDCIYLNQLAAFISSVRCEDCVGKAVNFWTVKRYPDWVNRILTLILILGVAFIVQLFLDLAIQAQSSTA